MDRYVGVLGAAVVAVLVAGCGNSATPTAEGTLAVSAASAPHESTSTGQDVADVRLMEVVPEVAAPGSRVELYFPAETMRGVAFYLDERVDGDWEREYTLSAVSGDSPAEPTWAPRDEELAWDDVGINGPGPDEVVLPPDLNGGTYRICTANAVDEFCAPFDVG